MKKHRRGYCPWPEKDHDRKAEKAVKAMSDLKVAFDCESNGGRKAGWRILIAGLFCIEGL